MSALQCGILGPLELTCDGRPIALPAQAARALLTLMALNPSTVMPAEKLVDALWGDELPADPRNALQTRVRKLRSALRAGGVDAEAVVQTRGRGYLLAVAPEAVDAQRFQVLVVEAAQATGSGRPAVALSSAESALSLWRGQALVDLQRTEYGQREIVRLDETRQHVEELRCEAMLRLGRPAEAAIVLRPLVEEFPFRERFAAQLMLSLYQCGRQAEALAVFTQTRNRLVEELGVDPSPELRELETKILNQDAEVASPVLVEAGQDTSLPGTDDAVVALANAVAGPDVAHRKTDTFRDEANYSQEVRQALEEARAAGPAEVRAVEDRLGAVADAESGVVIDLLLSYRAVGSWEDMTRVVAGASRPLAESILVREQLAFALNRLGRHAEAEEVLVEVLARAGASSETYSLLGRVHKDQWAAAAAGGDSSAADHISHAIDAYLAGFEADWRDAYPGVNVLTLMEMATPPDARRADLRPLVRYAVERRLADEGSDYWDHATLLELTVLDRDTIAARAMVPRVLSEKRESWEMLTTANNLALLERYFARIGEETRWLNEIVGALRAGAHEMSGATPAP